MSEVETYAAANGLAGKLRRRLVRLRQRRPMRARPTGPMVSFTFDDAPLSATTAGAEALEAHGLRGTFYVSAGLCGRDSPMGAYAAPNDYRRLAASGHEIACHTHSHMDCGQASADAASADVDANAAAFADWRLPPPTNFAYPYGDVSAGPKAALAPLFDSMRGLHHGLVTRGADLNQLPAVGIEGEDGEAVARRWLAAALRQEAWLILYTHDVAEAPSRWGCRPEVLARLVGEALAGGCEVVTVAEGMRRLLRRPARLSARLI